MAPPVTVTLIDCNHWNNILEGLNSIRTNSANKCSQKHWRNLCKHIINNAKKDESILFPPRFDHPQSLYCQISISQLLKNPLATKASLKVTVRELMVISVTMTSSGPITGLQSSGKGDIVIASDSVVGLQRPLLTRSETEYILYIFTHSLCYRH